MIYVLSWLVVPSEDQYYSMVLVGLGCNLQTYRNCLLHNHHIFQSCIQIFIYIRNPKLFTFETQIFCVTPVQAMVSDVIDAAGRGFMESYGRVYYSTRLVTSALLIQKTLVVASILYF